MIYRGLISLKIILLVLITNYKICRSDVQSSRNVLITNQQYSTELYEFNEFRGKNTTTSLTFSVPLNYRLSISTSFPKASVDYFNIRIKSSTLKNFSITIRGNTTSWIFGVQDICTSKYILRNNSKYKQCVQYSVLPDKNISVQVALAESRLIVNNRFYWWEVFDTIQLNFTGETNFEITDISLFGWSNITEACNCLYPGVVNISAPCDSNNECLCKYGFNGTQCNYLFNYLWPVVPSYGPFNNSILALPFNISKNIVVRIGTHDCISTIIDDCYYNMSYPLARFMFCQATFSTVEIGLTLPIQLCLESQCSILDGVSFTPKPAPVFETYSPLKTIMSGGIEVNIQGKNLDSLASPNLKIVQCSGAPQVKCNYISCGSNNSTKNICQYVTNSTTNWLRCYSPYLYATEEQFQSYYSLDLISLSPEVKVVLNPSIPKFNPLTKYFESNRYYLFNSDNSCCNEVDYSIKVGGLDVDDIIVNFNSISFKPPQYKPEKSPKDLDGASVVEIFVGNYNQIIGYMQYNPQFNYVTLAAVLGTLACVLIILVLIIIICMRKKRIGCFKENEVTPNIITLSLVDKLNEPLRSRVKRCLVSEDNLEVQKEIGKGNFGRVFYGKYKGTEVAIKTLSEKEASFEAKKEFLDEAVRMTDFTHQNVLTLIAITIRDDVPEVILPFMKNGDLRSFLLKYEEVITADISLKMLKQIASGMEYLASMCFVHRDLAARNCMVDDNLTAKVADFGLARDIYHQFYYTTEHSNIPLPVQWMPVECLDGKLSFSEKTDVWSFGVLMWEVFSRGSAPYFNIKHQQMKIFLIGGKRLDKPQFATDAQYNIMLLCWDKDPKRRPTFKEIICLLEDEALVQPFTKINTGSLYSLEPTSYPDVGYLTPSSIN